VCVVVGWGLGVSVTSPGVISEGSAPHAKGVRELLLLRLRTVVWESAPSGGRPHPDPILHHNSTFDCIRTVFSTIARNSGV